MENSKEDAKGFTNSALSNIVPDRDHVSHIWFGFLGIIRGIIILKRLKYKKYSYEKDCNKTRNKKKFRYFCISDNHSVFYTGNGYLSFRVW